MLIDKILAKLEEADASDLHIVPGRPPMFRIHGILEPMKNVDIISSSISREIAYSMLTDEQQDEFAKEFELDFSYSVKDLGRYRVNLHLQRGSVGITMRSLGLSIPPLASLKLPSIIESFTYLKNGLVLVTGPTGSGKSTTLASLLDRINERDPVHIITIEDPIEYLHSHKKALVEQREIKSDTKSFSTALKFSLRQDPDVILIGELRDLETIQAALTAAETGHLVFGTLHTNSAAKTIDRIIDAFPTGQQSQVRLQLSTTLRGVVAQQLIPSTDGKEELPVKF